MNIDWFTFAAQIVNFLVLVVLLRWLLYGPIVRAMSEREKKISSRLEEADRKQKEAQERIQEYEGKSRDIDRQKEQLIEDSRVQAREEHQRLLKEAKQEIADQRESWRDAVRREQDDLVSDLRHEAGELGLRAARRTLSELADTDLEEHMCDLFVSRLGRLDSEQREEVNRQLAKDGGEISVRSAFDLSGELRRRLGESIQEVFETNADIAFEQSSDLICGLELQAGGYSIGWNVQNFLRELEVEFAEQLNGK